MTAKTLVLLGLALLAGCKSHTSSVSLKGLTGDETTREVSYKSLYDVKSNELRITSVISYESSYHTPRGADAAADQGTIAAFRLLKWVNGEAAKTLFNGQPTVDANANPANDFPASEAGARIGSMYKWVGHWKGVALDWEGKPEGVPATVDVKVRIVLGSAIVANDGTTVAGDGSDACGVEPDAGMFGGGSNYVMPRDFCNELAHGLVEDDVVSYNGHIWVSEDEQPTVPGEPAEVNGTTLKLVKRMQDLRRANGSRNKQTFVYMNACHAEKIEQKLMEGMIDQVGADDQMPLLVSHRNYSNFGFFAEHDAVLMIDLLAGRSLAKIMLDLTTTLRPQSFQSLTGAPLGNETAAEAKQILGEYACRSEVQCDKTRPVSASCAGKPSSGKPCDWKNVLVVAYRVEDFTAPAGTQGAPGAPDTQTF